MKKIVIDRDIPFVKGVFEPFARVEYFAGGDITAAQVGDADALIVRTRTRCDEALLGGSAVKIVATATIGFDHIDTLWCRRNGIAVATAEGCNARGVLQWVAAVLALLARSEQGFDPRSRTVGIVGVGNVGRLVNEYARMWGFDTLCCDPPRELREGGGGFVPLVRVLQQADIVTLHTPLDASTRHMIDAEALAMMRPDAVLLNASRGEVVDTNALVASGRRCAIDVWEHEPDIDRRLLGQAFAATPHIAGYSLQGKANAAAMAVQAVAASLALPLAGWYPEGVDRSCPRAISWNEMCSTIERRCDLAAESERLRRRPELFEQMRSSYPLREEYF